MEEVYIGLMSGTSADGIDAVLVDFTEFKPKLIGTHYQEYTTSFRQAILALCEPGLNEIERLAEMDIQIAKAFAAATHQLLTKNSIKPASVRAIGSHGQTIRHYPDRQFSLQIGDPNIISVETDIITVADFRRKDLALGGQGAPLVPAFHQAIFGTSIQKVIANIGGIANVTILNEGNVLGYDTGPGNVLLDLWTEKHLKQRYDKEGKWAASGTIQFSLLEKFLADPFFQLKPPKSTGREYFNESWLLKHLEDGQYKPEDIQATLVELTARSILSSLPFTNGEVYICGGGVHNQFLMNRLKQLGTDFKIESTSAAGVDPDWVEAMAFAWLAKRTLEKKSGNITSVTGAIKSSILGGIYYT